jgi:hypothetical protein
MLTHDKKWNNEKGMVLVTSMFLTMALVVIGSFTVIMTTAELDIAKNDRFGKEAFFVADSGSPISTKVLRDVIVNKWILGRDYEEDYEAKGIIFDPVSLFNKVSNYGNPPDDEEPDIEATLLGSHLAIDLEWRARKSGAGSSILFAMGYEGVGVNRRHGGVKMYYDIKNKSTVDETTNAEINTVYLHQY